MNGTILRDKRIGETNINKNGLKMNIIEYINSRNITVKFENGIIVYNKKYQDFKNGNINENPNINVVNSKIGKTLKCERVGETNYNKYNSKMTIIKYISSDEIVVEFENKYITKCTYNAFKKGNVKNPYDKTSYNTGYLGEGIYLSGKDGKSTIEYNYWNTMLKRCYSKNLHKNHPTYKNCSVCEEWHNFQNFAKWFNKNYYQIKGEKMCLDKDILHKGNKIYSPENCVFVPQVINTLFTKCNSRRGNLPIGVTLTKNNRFRSLCKVFEDNIHKSKNLGTYKTIEEAFNVYKITKEQTIKNIADYYKEQIPQKLYNAMYNYRVEITD